MANDNIVAQLVSGSQNIDRMKAEVLMVVKMILGFIGSSESRKFVFGTDSCRWDVNIADRRDSRLSVSHMVSCLVRVLPKSEGGWFAFDSFTYTDHWASNSMKDVEVVYDSLHAFVEGMLREFPELEQKIAPILKASSKFPSAQ